MARPLLTEVVFFEVYYTIRNMLYGSSIAALYLNVYYYLRARRSKHACLQILN
jgi:hypothetical protein